MSDRPADRQTGRPTGKPADRPIRLEMFHHLLHGYMILPYAGCLDGKKAPGWSFHYEIAGDFPLFYSTLSFGNDLICVQNLMGMVSFLSSPVLGNFWLKKVKRMHSEGCLF
jgi:hypothetical protein